MLDRPPDDRNPFEIGYLSWEYGLRIAGELDLSTAQELTSALAELDREEEIVLDLQDVTFIDSMGMHALLAYARSFDPARPLVVANPPPVVLRLFELASVRRLPTIRIRIDAPDSGTESVADDLLDRAKSPPVPTLEPDEAA